MHMLDNVTVVAIDDTPAILTFLRVSLEALGAKVHEAMTAAGGIALCQDMQPDIVVLDLGLPDNDGLNILSRIKSANNDREAPLVVVLTVRSEQMYRDRATAEGADAYLTKPFRLESLIEVIQDKIKYASNSLY